MAIVNMNNSASTGFSSSLSIEGLLGDTVELIVETFSTSDFTIDWGDGTVETLSNLSSHSHTFTAESTGITISSPYGLEDIKGIDSGNSNFINFQGSLVEFQQFIAIEYLITKNDEVNKITGTFAQIPKTLTTFRSFGDFTGYSVITGNLIDLPPNLEYLTIENNTLHSIFGNISDIPSNIVYFNISKANIDGDIKDIPNTCSYIYLDTLVPITGNIINLPISLQTIHLYGTIQITGDIANFSPNITKVNIWGSNTLYGNIQDVTIPDFTVAGYNTISGSLHEMTENFTLRRIHGNNDIQNLGIADFTGFSIPLNYDINVSSNFTPTQVDQLIIDLDSAGFSAGVILVLSGNGVSRTSASDAAYTNITSGGGTIILNP